MNLEQKGRSRASPQLEDKSICGWSLKSIGYFTLYRTRITSVCDGVIISRSFIICFDGVFIL